MGRGKRMSRGNLIGKEGQLAFQQWALKNGLSATEVDSDIGIDFFCQVLAPIVGSTSLEGEGPVLCVQVKTVAAGDQPRLILNRIDAEDLLRQRQVTCVFGVHLENTSVHFQFVNRPFMDKLLQLIASDRETLSLPYSSMSDDVSLFRRQLLKLADPAEQTLHRLHLMQGRLRKAIPESHLHLELSDQGKSYRVELPWLSSAFSVDPSFREAVRVRLFQQGFLDPTQEGVTLHPQIEELFDEAQITNLTLRGEFQRVEKLEIRLGSKKYSQSFDVYVFEDEISFVHRDGLQLTISGARPTGEHYAHHFENDLFEPLHKRPLKGASLSFFRMFQEGATLALPTGSSWPLNQFGENLVSLSTTLEAMLKVHEGLELTRSSLFLHDLKNEEFARTCWMLEALFLKDIPLEQLARGFVLGPAAEIPSKDLSTCDISMLVPLVLNLKQTGVTVWIECSAQGFLYEGVLCGMRILKQHNLSKVEKGPRLAKSRFPEMWVYRDWPGIPIGTGQEGIGTFERQEALPFDAEIYSSSKGTEDTA